MNEPDFEQLTLFQADSPANRSALPGSDAARTMTVTSGLKCLELYRNSGPLGSLVKMLLESSIWHSTRCFLRWKIQVTKSRRLLFRLAVSMPRTSGTDVQLWPTATAGVHGKKRYKQGGKPLTMAYAEKFRGSALTPEFVEWLMGYEQQFTKLIPTVTTTDARTNSLGRYWRPRSQSVQVERERESKAGIRRKAAEPCGVEPIWENWPSESGILRVANGVPDRVDRIKCLGNAVVPQQFYPIFKAIHDIEAEQWHGK